MQVQRAMIGKETYTEWDDLGRVELPPDATAKAGAVILMEAVENKRKGAASDVVLLLDAVRLPWLALREVVSEFGQLYAAYNIKGLFQAIDVVPWHESAIRRLDAPA